MSDSSFAQYAPALLIGYIGLCRIFRYKARDGIHAKFSYNSQDDMKKMTTHEAWEIQEFLTATEFPFTYEKALQFALFKTYGIPTISKLLMKTKQLSDSRFAGKRYTDTEILIAEFLSSPPDSDRTKEAISRMNYIHSIYQNQGLISNDDLLYTLALFILEPISWISRYEWRSLSDLEICAM
jgi:hypothetical protein